MGLGINSCWWGRVRRGSLLVVGKVGPILVGRVGGSNQLSMLRGPCHVGPMPACHLMACAGLQEWGPQLSRSPLAVWSPRAPRRRKSRWAPPLSPDTRLAGWGDQDVTDATRGQHMRMRWLFPFSFSVFLKIFFFSFFLGGEMGPGHVFYLTVVILLIFPDKIIM